MALREMGSMTMIIHAMPCMMYNIGQDWILNAVIYHEAVLTMAHNRNTVPRPPIHRFYSIRWFVVFTIP